MLPAGCEARVRRLWHRCHRRLPRLEHGPDRSLGGTELAKGSRKKRHRGSCGAWEPPDPVKRGAPVSHNFLTEGQGSRKGYGFPEHARESRFLVACAPRNDKTMGLCSASGTTNCVCVRSSV